MKIGTSGNTNGKKGRKGKPRSQTNVRRVHLSSIILRHWSLFKKGWRAAHCGLVLNHGAAAKETKKDEER